MFHHTGGSGDCQRFPGEKTAKNQFFRGFADIGGVWARMAKRGGCREEGETSSVFGLRPNPPSPRGKAKLLNLQRLHRNLQKNPCGDFAEDSFRVKRKFKGILCNQSRPECSRLPDRMEPQRGAPGGSAKWALPPGGFPPLSTRESGPTARCTLQQQKKGQPHHPPRGGISSLQQTLGHQRLHAA